MNIQILLLQITVILINIVLIVLLVRTDSMERDIKNMKVEILRNSLYFEALYKTVMNKGEDEKNDTSGTV